MNIDQAIEILHLLFGRIYEGSDLDRDNAIKLGIEALKFLQERRHSSILINFPLLPGETK